MRRAGFTLLEAILALSIIAAVTVVCLGMRAQALGAARRISESQHAEQGAQDIYDSVMAGLMPAPVIDPRSGTRTWEGEWSNRPYVLTATLAALPSPVISAEADGSAPRPMLRMWRYELRYAGQTTEFFWSR